MPKFRTPKNERTTYIYRDAYGRKYEIAPDDKGADGQAVTAKHIVMLHGYDDDSHNAVKRDAYHGVHYYEQESIDDGETLDDKQVEFADYASNPETMLIDAMEATERSGEFKAVWDSLTDKQRDLVMKKLLKRKTVDIAKEENTTEAAIRSRISKIQKKFEKFLK